MTHIYRELVVIMGLIGKLNSRVVVYESGDYIELVGYHTTDCYLYQSNGDMYPTPIARWSIRSLNEPKF